jgi:hypothetical protein
VILNLEDDCRFNLGLKMEKVTQKCYSVTNKKGTFFQAGELCRLLSAKLAVPRSMVEQNAIIDAISASW